MKKNKEIPFVHMYTGDGENTEEKKVAKKRSKK